MSSVVQSFGNSKEQREMCVVVKADVQGSAEALTRALRELKLENDEATVTITVEGEVQSQTTAVPRADLVTRLRAIAAERASDRVFLRADGAVPYASVMEVMGALNAGGFSNIGLVTDIGGPALDSAPVSGN